MTTLRHVAVRQSIALLAALLLASSALIAVSAETQAAKPIPSVSYIDGSTMCTSSGNALVLEASFDLSANKGRWVYVQIEYQLAGLPGWGTYVAAGERTDNKPPLLVSRPFMDVVPSAYRVTMTDRKANLLDGPMTVATSDPGDCP